MLRHHNGTIRLVVLSACGSGDGHGDPLFMSSLAQELHKKGIPNVVASRYPLSVPGSRAITRALYDKMLREAWSLERALRHTREALLRVGGDGECHLGDAYGIQLYAYDTERFVSDNEVVAERPVLGQGHHGQARHRRRGRQCSGGERRCGGVSGQGQAAGAAPAGRRASGAPGAASAAIAAGPRRAHRGFDAAAPARQGRSFSFRAE